ncbi:MAG: hypothetical protein AAFP69_08535 [Planctomycetota bacterium]
MPSKLYGILAAGRPVIAIDHPESDLAKLVVDQRIGWVVDAEDDATIGKTMMQVAGSTADERHSMGTRARALCEQHYDLPNAVDSFRRLLQGLSTNV